MITIDGKKYNVLIKKDSLKRSFEIAEGPGSLEYLDGDSDPDIIGTYYNYSLEIDARMASPEEYDSLFEVISAPVAYHTVSFPYGQSTLTFKARITGGEDVFLYKMGGKQYWGGLSLQFSAKQPQRSST